MYGVLTTVPQAHFGYGKRRDDLIAVADFELADFPDGLTNNVGAAEGVPGFFVLSALVIKNKCV